MGQPHHLEIHAPFPTYQIDYIIQRRHELTKSESHDKFFLVREGHPWPFGKPHYVFRETFNNAAHAAERARPNEDEFKAAKKMTEFFFEEVKQFDQIIHETDPEKISWIAIPIGEREAGQDVEQDVWDVGYEFDSLQKVIKDFLSNVTIPIYESTAGNRDLFTSCYIKELANDGRLSPFTPVTQKNWQDFARLIAVGWEDLGFSQHRGNSQKYQTVYGWLSDRVRSQLGFRRTKNDVQNPK